MLNYSLIVHFSGKNAPAVGTGENAVETSEPIEKLDWLAGPSSSRLKSGPLSFRFRIFSLFL